MSGSLVYDNALFYMQFSSDQISGIQNVRVEFFKFPIMFGFQIFLFLPKVVMNEINVDDPSKPELNELIELVNFGKKGNLMQEQCKCRISLYVDIIFLLFPHFKKKREDKQLNLLTTLIIRYFMTHFCLYRLWCQKYRS